jgi:hypothetical protein
MTMGLSIKAMIGLCVLIVGLMLASTSNVILHGIEESITSVRLAIARGVTG